MSDQEHPGLPPEEEEEISPEEELPSEELVPLGAVLEELEKQTAQAASEAAKRLLPTGKTPPHALDAERALLGGILIEPSAIEKALDEGLRPDDFYRKAHGVLFRVMCDLHHAAEPIDSLTVVDELHRRGLLEAVGGPKAVSDLELLIPTAAHVGAYARLLREKATLRRLIETATEVVSAAYRQDRRVVDILDDAERAILAISERNMRRGIVPMSELVKRATEQLERAYNLKSAITGVASGFSDLDRMTSGFQPGELIIVAARPSMGKCLARSAEIVLEDGSLATIEELVRRREATLLTLDDRLRLRWTSPSAFVDDGIKPIFRVTTRLGRRALTTLSHPFLTQAGWRRLEALKVGDRVAVPRRLPVFGRERMPEHEVKLLAYLLGDGGLVDTCPEFTNQDPRVRADFEEALLAFGGVRASLDVRDGKTPVGREGEALSLAPKNPLTAWLRELGTFRKCAHEKQIPDPIFRLPKDQLALFLNRLFATDGWATVLASEKAQVGYSTVSERLARQVQHLLLRFGVLAKLRRRQIAYGGGRRRAYQLDITDGRSLATFSEEIGIFGKEEAVQRLALALGDAALLDLATSDVYWDEIVAIEPLGREQVYDLTVPETHNFVADDVCVHNTAFTLNVAAHAAMRNQAPVAFFSLEMGAEQLVQRLIGAEARIDISNLRRGVIQSNEWVRLAQAASELAEAPLYIDETPSLTVAEMRTKCRRLLHEHGIKLIIVDYLQLMQGPDGYDNKATEVGEISKGLKNLARELNVPVIALSQLNRGVESRTDKRPLMSDLRESGAIEQDADLIMFLYREEYYLRDKTPEDKLGLAEIIVGKHRNGPTGTVMLRFFNSITRFENLEREHDDYAP